MLINKLFEKTEQEYRAKTKKSYEFHQNAKTVMPGGNTRSVVYYNPYPLTIVSGNGAYIYDIDGNKYFDLVNNYTSMVHGHCHPIITNTIQTALSKGICYASTIIEQAELAQLLIDRIPSIELIRFCNSGSEASLFAIRAARAYMKRSSIIKIEGGYHGMYDYVDPSLDISLSQPAHHLISNGIPNKVLDDVYSVPFNQIEPLENILTKHSSEIACMLIEPVLGASGVIPPAPGYLTELRMLADRFNVLLIFDEVQTIRLDYGGAQTKFNVIPDITILGKIIGGGLPIGAFGGRRDIMSLFDHFNEGAISHSGTFNGNLISMAAGISSMQMLNKASIQHLEEMAYLLETRLMEAILKFKISASITRAGSLLNVHFTKITPVDYASARKINVQMRSIFHLMLLNKGIFIAPRGMLNLSTVMSFEDIQNIVKIFSEVLEELASELK